MIVQAKHWLSKSVGMEEIAANDAAVKLWQPPVARRLLIVTSGRFSSDAVAWVDQHTESAVAPHIDLWPESRLEMLLAQRLISWQRTAFGDRGFDTLLVFDLSSTPH